MEARGEMKLTLDEFLDYMDGGKEVVAGSEEHLYMCALSGEAIRLTMELNGSYHTAGEIVSLMRQITGREVDDSFSLFPPFYTIPAILYGLRQEPENRKECILQFWRKNSGSGRRDH